MSQSKKIPKGILFATLGLMLPAVIIAIAFFAAQHDAKNKAEYDRIRAEQAKKIAEKAQSEQNLKVSHSQ